MAVSLRKSRQAQLDRITSELCRPFRDMAYCDAQLYDYGMTVRRVELTGRHANGRQIFDPYFHDFAPLTAFSL